jgi:TrpR-related protein YerC/YecD
VLSPGEDWRTPDADALLDALLLLRTRDEAAAFLRDLCTLGEIHDLGQRWAVVRLLSEGRHYGEISRATGASTATITRIAGWLRHGAGGYRLMLERSGLAAVPAMATDAAAAGQEAPAPGAASRGGR